MPEPRRFPPPWSVEEPDPKLGRRCFIVRDAKGHAPAYVYFEEEPGRRSAVQPPHPRRGPTHRRQHRQAAGAGTQKGLTPPQQILSIL
jgi:hypothetical protein